MDFEATRKDNLAKADQLRPEARWAYVAWINECFDSGLAFRVSEVFRTQERQEQLYKIGRRGIPGEEPVTWTRNSYHTQGLAADCYPINCSHQQIADIGIKYGITWPFPSKDPPHREFLNVKQPSEVASPEQKLTQLQKALKWAQGLRRAVILRAIARLQRLLGRVS